MTEEAVRRHRVRDRECAPTLPRRRGARRPL
jgi:hypothetical protein